MAIKCIYNVMKYQRFILILIGLIFMSGVVRAQERYIEREDRKLVKVYFRQGSSTIEEGYMGNKQTLDKFAQEVNSYCQDSTARFRRIRVVASASPEGSAEINERLVKQRAEAITEWISRKISTKLGYDVESTGIDWQMLVELVRENPDVPYADEVVELITNTPEYDADSGNTVNARYEQLRELREGEPYRWINTNIFPKMRYASARAEFWWEREYGLIITSAIPVELPSSKTASTITYEKNVPDTRIPQCSTSADWITITGTTDNSVGFDAAENTIAAPRSATIELQYAGKSYQVEVNQAAAEPRMTITTESPVRYPASGGVGAIEYTTNSPDKVVPAAKSDADWINVEKSDAEKVDYEVAENESVDQREDQIELSCFGQTQEVSIIQDGAKPYYWALKTNALYDLLAIPSIGAEVYLGKNFSIAANWSYAWWKNDNVHWYHRVYGGDLAARYWLGKRAAEKPLTGHHVGIYGQMITYDFETGNRGILADRWSWAFGAEYGYSLPIGYRLNLDFTVGLGYHWGEYKEYLPIDECYVWQATKKRRYLGPTKIEVSLVWLLGRGNYNKDKVKNR